MKHFYENFSDWFISIGCKIVCLKIFHSHCIFKVNRYTKSFRTSSSFPLLPLPPTPQLLSFSQHPENGVSFCHWTCTPIPFLQQNRAQAWAVHIGSTLKAEGNGDLDCLALVFQELVLLTDVYIHLLLELIYHGDFVCLLLSKRMKAFAWGRKTTRYSLQKCSIFSHFNL